VRIGQEADSRHRVRRAVIGTEEAWALDELPRRSPSSARAPRAPRSRAPTAASGTDVLLFEALDRVLPTEDADISKAAGRGLASRT
jgi:dihydrolipoamide dehydrogenase